MRKGRQSNFELFRILSAFLIIMHHYVVHSTWEFGAGLGTKRLFLDIIGSAGKFGVNCFLLISGFFLVNSFFKPKKILLLWLEVFFYSMGIFLIIGVFTKEVSGVDLKEIMMSLMPVTFNQYWFVGSYILFYCLAPIMNILIKNMTRKQHIFILLLLFVFLSIKPAIAVLFGVYLNSENGIWFLFIYFIAAYIREYPEYFSRSAKNYFIKSLSVWLVIVAIITYIDLSKFNEKDLILKKWLLDISNPIYLILAVFLFCGFKNWKIRRIPAINLLGSATLGVYLIHDNRYIRSFLWQGLTGYKSSYEGIKLVFTTIIIVFSVYLVCSMIDLVRQKLFKVLHMT